MSDNTHSTSDTNSTGTKTSQRCKHDLDMVNEANARLLKIKAVADLLFCTRSGDLAEETLSNVGWLLIDLANQTAEIVGETEEVAA